MNIDLEKQVQSFLIGIMSDGFNRSVNALEEAGAINTKKMRKEYTGIGSKYYDIVTRELEYTAKYTAKQLIEKIEEEIKTKNKSLEKEKNR